MVGEVRGPSGCMDDEGKCVGCGIPQAAWMVMVCVGDDVSGLES